jgi:hypothetical protein
MSLPLLPSTSALLRTVRECHPLFPNAIQAAMFDELHTIGALNLLPSTAGGYVVFDSTAPLGKGVLEGPIRDEGQAHAALERRAGQSKGKRSRKAA